MAQDPCQPPLQETSFARQLQSELARPFDLQELNDLYVEFPGAQPNLLSKTLRSGSVQYHKDDFSPDWYPDLLSRLKKAGQDSERKLWLLRGYRFWLIRASAEGAFPPWRPWPRQARMVRKSSGEMVVEFSPWEAGEEQDDEECYEVDRESLRACKEEGASSSRERQAKGPGEPRPQRGPRDGSGLSFEDVSGHEAEAPGSGSGGEGSPSQHRGSGTERATGATWQPGSSSRAPIDLDSDDESANVPERSPKGAAASEQKGVPNGKGAVNQNGASVRNVTSYWSGASDGNGASKLNAALDRNKAFNLKTASDQSGASKLNRDSNRNGASDQKGASARNGATKLNGNLDGHGASNQKRASARNGASNQSGAPEPWEVSRAPSSKEPSPGIHQDESPRPKEQTMKRIRFRGFKLKSPPTEDHYAELELKWNTWLTLLLGSHSAGFHAQILSRSPSRFASNHRLFDLKILVPERYSTRRVSHVSGLYQVLTANPSSPWRDRWDELVEEGERLRSELSK